ncbi:autotransporter domain-containing protein [Serratia microhaemolytica]|uniref:autotransporter domain-containing protein n=1 Tax=Serratia microhaemolytica TaxID=2675110 RepID=UPI000FDE0AD8|nr:autotransporter domain-containing protein [Serratia microhaemolytica]
MLNRITVSALVSALCFAATGAGAAESNTVAARSITATELLAGFSQLNNSAAGRAVLEQNLNTSIAINNNASAAQRARAIADNTILALVGSMDNGLLVANALGERMYDIFAANNRINASNGAATTFSKNFQRLLSQVNALTMADSSFAKNFYANGSINGDPANPAQGISLPEGGSYNVYDQAYAPKEEDRNSVGNSRPVQVAPDRITHTYGADFFGRPTDSASEIVATVKSNAAFPSGHSTFGFTNTLLFAQMVPELFQEFLLRGSEYGNSRITLGMHYALDVIGARIMATYALAQILNNQADYIDQNISSLFGEPMTTSSDFNRLLTDAGSDLRALLQQGCQTSIAQCVAAERQARASEAAKNKADYLYRLTYGLSPVGPTDLAPVVPEGAEVLIASRFPYLSAEQRREVLATTEIESGHALDDGSGWARLNLYAAADGYGAFNRRVAVNMDASQGGFSAYDSWGNDISGSGEFIKQGSGVLELTGNNSFSGSTTVEAGALLVNGYHGNSNVSVQNGATLGGSGTVGALTVQNGGTVMPGIPGAALQVKGTLSFADGARYQVAIGADGSSDQISSKRALLNGGDVVLTLADRGNLLAQPESSTLLGQHRILSAEQGVSGQFAALQSDYLFLTGQLIYQPDQVLLQLQRSNTQFTDVAQGRNQRAVADAIAQLAAGDPVYESLLSSATEQQAQEAYRQLSGQIHADIASAQLNSAQYLRENFTARLRQRPDATRQHNSQPAWAQLLTARDRALGNSDAGGYQASHDGVLVGIEPLEGDDWQSGISFGYTRTALNGANSAHADSDNYHLGLYGAKWFGDWVLRGGSSYSWQRIDSERQLHYGSQAASLNAKYNATMQQLFAEFGYRIDGALTLEPFFNLAYSNVSTNPIAEQSVIAAQGNAAALHSSKQHMQATSSTLGVRGSAQLAALSLHAELAWRYQYHPLDRASGLMFQDSAAELVVNSVAASRHAALVKLAGEWALSDRSAFSLDYAGSLSKNHQDNRIQAGFNWRF